MVSYDEHFDSLDWRNDPDASAPPTEDEQRAMLEHISVMQAVALLRERGFAVIEPVDMNGQVRS